MAKKKPKDKCPPHYYIIGEDNVGKYRRCNKEKTFPGWFDPKFADKRLKDNF